jgi:hypothetical protein
MYNHFIDLTQIHIPKYILLDELYDYDEILSNLQEKSLRLETRKRKRSDDDIPEDI